jgi:hypothetical protein
MTETAQLQLDRAEFDTEQEAATCAACTASLRYEYYEVNGQMVCTDCRVQMKAAGDHGTRLSRILRAGGAGFAAALGGAILYWAILAITGYEFGLIAVVVGVGVGKAVNWGSRGKGGWRYQAIAMSLTYLAMVGAYVPLLLSQIPTDATAQTQTPGDSAATTQPSGTNATEPPTLVGGLLAVAVLVVVICALPFMQGIQNIIGILILGFGLYEAWKLNRRVDLVITGPHAIAQVQAT